MKEGLIQGAQSVQAAKKGPATMQDYIKKMQGEIAKALPSVLTPERFTRITLSALSTNPKLAQTTPKSFLGAMMTAACPGVSVPAWLQGPDRPGLSIRRGVYHPGADCLRKRRVWV